MAMIPVLAIVSVAALFSLGFTVLLVKYRRIIAIVDVPNHRSSHAVPKPRTGGIALMTAVLAGTFAAWAFFPRMAIGRLLFYGAAAYFALGLAEDVFHLSERVRLVVQAVIAAILAFCGLSLPGVLAAVFTVFWYVGFVNVFNFLDGIDGYAASEALLAGIFIAILSRWPGPLLISAAAAGFLVFNFQPARLFMGDSGSYLLGFLLAALCVEGSLKSGVPVEAFILVLGTFIVDAAATLAKRIMRRESWMKAHRSHYYQRLTDLGFSHAEVALMNMGLTALLGLSAMAYAHAGTAFRGAILAAWAAIFACLIALIERAAAI